MEVRLLDLRHFKYDSCVEKYPCFINFLLHNCRRLLYSLFCNRILHHTISRIPVLRNYMMRDGVITDKKLICKVCCQEQGARELKTSVKEARFTRTTKNVNANMKRIRL